MTAFNPRPRSVLKGLKDVEPLDCREVERKILGERADAWQWGMWSDHDHPASDRGSWRC